MMSHRHRDSGGRNDPSRMAFPAWRLIALCLCVVVLAGAGWAQTNLGPILVTTLDFTGFASSPGNPFANQCRMYFNTTTGLIAFVNSSGGNCGPSGGGGTGTVSPNSGNVNALAYYPAAAGSTTVSPNAVATLDSSGNFLGNSYGSPSGGPFLLHTPFAGATPGCITSQSCMAVSSDGNFYNSNNNGTFYKEQLESATSPVTNGVVIFDASGNTTPAPGVTSPSSGALSLTGSLTFGGNLNAGAGAAASGSWTGIGGGTTTLTVGSNANGVIGTFAIQPGSGSGVSNTTTNATAVRSLVYPDASGNIGVSTGTLTAGHCLDVASDALRIQDAGTTCGGATPGGSTDATQYNAGGTLGGVNSPILQGLYNYGYNPTTAAAVAPAVFQVGLGGRAISGSTATDTVLYSDVDNVINHDLAGSASVVETIPVPTTAVGSGGLGNTAFAFQYCNHSSHIDSLSPTTWTIQAGTGAAGATLSVAAGACYRVKVDPFNATNWLADASGVGNSSFAAITSGNNTSAAMTAGANSNLSPLNSGQVAASQLWMPPGQLAPAMSFATSGGGFLNGHAISVRVAFVNASGTTLPGLAAQGGNASFGCSTGTACLLTITAPSVPTGYTGYNVYAQDCNSLPCGGSETLQAGCTNITANCVLSSVGGGSAIPTTISAYVQPPNVQASPCPQGVIPWLYMPDTSGNYRVLAGNDLSSNNGRTSGTLDFCLPIVFDDQAGLAPAPANPTGEPLYGNNSFVSINHQTCTNTSCTNQDRALWLNVQNPSADSASHYSIDGLQAEVDITGHPSGFSAVDGETAVFSGQLADETDASYSSGTPGGGSQTMRLTYVREPKTGGTGLGNGGAIYTATSNGYLSAAGAGTVLYGANFTFGGGGVATNLTGVGINIGFPTTGQLFGTANWGIVFGYPGLIGSNAPTVNSTTYGIVNFITGLPFSFNGPISTWSIANSNPGAFPLYGSLTDQGSITITQMTAPAQNSSACSGGSSQYSYVLVAVDGNGGTEPGSTQNTPSTCTNPLTSGNPATVQPNTTSIQMSSAVRFDVYRTGGPMATGKIGSLTCVTGSRQISCNSFSDTGLTASGTLPTTNTTGTLVANGPTISTASGPVSGSWQCTNVTPVSVSANVSTDQNLLTCTIPAGTLNSLNKSLRIWLAGVYSTPAASTTAVTVKVKLCTVSGCGSGTVVSLLNITTTALAGVQATNDQFNIHAYSTTQTAGSTASFEAHGNLLIDLGVGNTVADSNFGDTNTATVGTIDTTAQLFLQSTVSFSAASASNTATGRQLVVDTVN